MQQQVQFAHKSLLIVDDEDMHIFIARKCLQKIAEFTLFTANNGQQALDVLQANDVHLLLTDLNMPIMDGYELVSRLRQDFTRPKRDMPVIALTADALERAELISAGIDDVLLKPFTRDALLKKLHAVLQ